MLAGYSSIDTNGPNVAETQLRPFSIQGDLKTLTTGSLHFKRFGAGPEVLLGSFGGNVSQLNEKVPGLEERLEMHFKIHTKMSEYTYVDAPKLKFCFNAACVLPEGSSI